MNRVDWGKISAIAEILSAIAIVVTLAYLALQTRYLAEQTALQMEQNQQNSELLVQNNDLLRAQIHQARSDTYESFIVASADAEFFLPMWEKFQAAGGPRDVSSLEVLDSIEIMRLRRYLQGRLGGYDNLHYQYQNGYLDEEFYRARVVGSIRLYADIYEELGLFVSSQLTPSFLEEIERIRSSE